jgi:hypothetical protein
MPVQAISKEKVRGPLTVAADCKAVGSANVIGDFVMFVTHVVHVPKGGFELRVEDVARKKTRLGIDGSPVDPGVALEAMMTIRTSAKPKMALLTIVS